MNNRQFGILLGGLFLVLLTLSILQGTLLDQRKQPEVEVLPNRSVYNNRPSGYAAWYQALLESHVPVKVWTKDVTDLNKEKETATMLVVEPYPYSMAGETFSSSELAGLLYWVSMGNTLILLDPFERESTRNILSRFELAPIEKKPVPEALTHAQAHKDRRQKPGPLELPTTPDIPASSLALQLDTLPEELQWMTGTLQHVPHGISTQARTRFPATTENVPVALAFPPIEPDHDATPQETGDSQEDLSADDPEEEEEEDDVVDPEKTDPYSLKNVPVRPFHPIVLAKDTENHPYLLGGQYGEGLLILGTTTDLAANQGLFNRTHNNYQFLTNLVTLSGKPVLLNEFVHGHQEKDSAYGYLSKTPIGIIFSQFVLLFCLILWSSFQRWRPTLEDPQKPGMTASQDFVSSVSHIYQRVGATPLAIAPLMHILEALIRKHRICDFKDEKDLEALSGLVIASYTLTPLDVNTLKQGHTVVHKQKKLGAKETLQLSQALSLLIYCLQGSKKECILPESVSSSH